LKLLLDEMYPQAIAEHLARKGHDVDAVTARADLRGLSDHALFAHAQAESRTIVTENVVDFSRIADELDGSGRVHHGLVLIDPARYPRGQSRTIGRLVRGLDRLLAAHPHMRADSRRHWL
jgi:Domain of unknown function (DUF5615)